MGVATSRVTSATLSAPKSRLWDRQGCLECEIMTYKRAALEFVGAEPVYGMREWDGCGMSGARMLRIGPQEASQCPVNARIDGCLRGKCGMSCASFSPSARKGRRAGSAGRSIRTAGSVHGASIPAPTTKNTVTTDDGIHHLDSRRVSAPGSHPTPQMSHAEGGTLYKRSIRSMAISHPQRRMV